MDKHKQDILSAFCVADLDNPITYLSLIEALENADKEAQLEYQIKLID